MRSYVGATFSNTPRTKPSFSPTPTSLKPKLVVSPEVDDFDEEEEEEEEDEGADESGSAEDDIQRAGVSVKVPAETARAATNHSPPPPREERRLRIIFTSFDRFLVINKEDREDPRARALEDEMCSTTLRAARSDFFAVRREGPPYPAPLAKTVNAFSFVPLRYGSSSFAAWTLRSLKVAATTVQI